MKRVILITTSVLFIGFVAIQCYHPRIPTSSANAEIVAQENVKAVLRKDCYSCHSSEARLSWFDQVQPAYSLVRSDVLDARQHLNFSTLGSKPAAAQKAVLYEAVTMMQLGAMPLPSFTALHPDARVSPQDIAVLQQYLSPWSAPIQPLVATDMENSSAPDHAPPSPNGLPYDNDWHHWKLLAVTDRGDNHQFRMVLGNNIAVQAARSGKVHPWPDGTRFAKAAWFQAKSAEGSIVPSKFWQVELMVKDAAAYRQTDGWGWGRWRDTTLKPYGKDPSVVQECTGCHQPVKGNDYVYTQPFSAAETSGHEVLNAASVRWPSGLGFDPLTWTPITLLVDPSSEQILVLFAEDESNAAAGSSLRGKLALVTWNERDDPHWFGARMADRVISVETLSVSNGLPSSYAFVATDSGKHPPADQLARARWIASLHAPTMR